MKKCVKIFLIVFCLVAVAFSFFYFKQNNLKCELVCEVPTEYDENIAKSLPWFAVVSEEYSPMFGVGNLTNDYNVDSEKINYTFDCDNYSYVVCYGHRLNKLSFRYSDVLKRTGLLIPYEMWAKATLSSKQEDFIFIYKFKKKNISYNYHGESCTVYE